MRNTEAEYHTAVFDMQPISPPVGGGRIRLLGLYHGLGMPTEYIGSYDWPGEKYREKKLTPTLTEIIIPLGEKHYDLSEKIKVGKRTVIDTTFARFARYSPRFCERAEKAVENSDILVFSHPWILPVVKKKIRKEEQLVVYDAQNVEGFLRYKLLIDGGNSGKKIVRDVIKQEADILHFSHLVLVCSFEDALLFNKLYGTPLEKMRVVPNGVFPEKYIPIIGKQIQKVRKKFRIDSSKSALFFGSDYEPNLEAAKYICESLARSIPDIKFVIAGGVGLRLESELHGKKIPSNVVITGFIDEKEKHVLQKSVSLAINPVLSGSGSNVKMFEYMGAGCPIISTPTGARGIDEFDEEIFIRCEIGKMEENIKNLLKSPGKLKKLSAGALLAAENKYSWSKLSDKTGQLLKRHRNNMFLKKPFFSIIIPSLNRPKELTRLVRKLAKQSYRDFEIIIVDQSRELWSDSKTDFGIDLFYINDTIRGAGRARNLGAFYSRGLILAFIDDDCVPSPQWLENASRYFNFKDVIGVEGLIRSEKIGDPKFRTVCNENFRSIGFMTANLFLRMEIFQRIGGFDERFDNPHFREDTDLGWRALEFGKIPFGNDVEVFHPPHPRNKKRESKSERNRFFEKDALLLKKHPDRFRKLFVAEKLNKTEEYWKNFLRGSKKYRVEIPGFYFSHMGGIFNKNQRQFVGKEK